MERKTLGLLNKTEFIQSFHKNNIVTGMRNIRSDWGILRENGFGVKYNKKWIIDPMFDSELFTLFDLYTKFEKESEARSITAKDTFKNLFEVLSNQSEPKSALVSKIVQWLPCDMFICEEHLKNWVAKKLYAESLLLARKYQTKKYFILGMGLLNGKRMSASKGTAILASDLINCYGPTKARLIIILGGGCASKAYNYDKSLPEQADKLLNSFTNYYTYLVSLANKEIHMGGIKEDKLIIETISDAIERNIDKGYYRQAIIELFSILPKKYKSPTTEAAHSLMLLYKKYLDILLPSLLDNFAQYRKR